MSKDKMTPEKLSKYYDSKMLDLFDGVKRRPKKRISIDYYDGNDPRLKHDVFTIDDED